ncbi:MAG: RNA-binding transcriptional accessory protein [Planctomycetes bacterium]|nr:RNA-binding transcriptional accessory protein [Planctomycetota bacterium]
MQIAEKIAAELSLRPEQVANTLALLAAEGTVPFIARYRKEKTGGLDEEKVRAIRERHLYLAGLENRRQAVLRSIEAVGKLTDPLRAAIEASESHVEIEDHFLPYKPKRNSRAAEARERGLEPLARAIWDQEPVSSLDELAASYASKERGVPDGKAALAGASTILAEMVGEDAALRKAVREEFTERGVFRSKVGDASRDKKSKFTAYYDFEVPIPKLTGPVLLALRRGERQGALSVTIEVDEPALIARLEGILIRDAESSHAPLLREAIREGFARGLRAPIVAQVRTAKKREADEEAVATFARNLRNLLLAPAAGPRVVLAIEPGLRNGARIAVVDPTGKPLATSTLFIQAPQGDPAAAAAAIVELIKTHRVELIAIGTGTGAREADALVAGAIASLPQEGRPGKVLLPEAGSNAYGSSDLAARELPDLEPPLRSAVSLARRLQDPLVELVKIEPLEIGVGQYQHEVDQRLLQRALGAVLESCVNRVGIDANSASAALLRHVSGIGTSLAEAIVAHRTEHGPFRSREDFRKLPRVNDRIFEQAAGFLRIRDGDNPLDASAIHPESYSVVDRIAHDLGADVKTILGNEAVLDRVVLRTYVDDRVGLETLRDIIHELRKPGRDPRAPFRLVRFDEKVSDIQALQVGMRLEGIVTNVTPFGAFVDIGVHQDGLVHISQLRDGFVRTPDEVVRVGEVVTVRVIGVDLEKKRISLSMRGFREGKPEPRREGGRREGAKPEGARREGGRREPRRGERGEGRREPRRGGPRRSAIPDAYSGRPRVYERPEEPINEEQALADLLKKWGDPFSRRRRKEEEEEEEA